MSRAAATNFTETGENFDLASGASESFKKEDVQRLQVGVDNHTHGSTRGKKLDGNVALNTETIDVARLMDEVGYYQAWLGN